ncbi:MAG: hypothetical protein KAJ19_19440 [Gammaproteobacteria bacterium]|nr:hypothetical protein [Gammaproteobacteria bacterium]
MRQDNTSALREERDEEIHAFSNPPIVFVTREEREAEMAQLNDHEELYHCIPPQNRDVVDIIKASDIASL